MINAEKAAILIQQKFRETHPHNHLFDIKSERKDGTFENDEVASEDEPDRSKLYTVIFIALFGIGNLFLRLLSSCRGSDPTDDVGDGVRTIAVDGDIPAVSGGGGNTAAPQAPGSSP